MKRMIPGKRIALVLVAVLVFGMASVADAQRGQGMMGRQQPGDYGERGMDYGPGMMGGPGMGMMYGHGMGGPGMGMMGSGMGTMGCLILPDLSEEQREQLRSIQRDTRRNHMEAMLEMMEIRDDMMLEMAAERPDAAKVRELQEAMSSKHADMIESGIESRNRMNDLFTDEQREQMRQFQDRGAYGPGHRWNW